MSEHGGDIYSFMVNNKNTGRIYDFSVNTKPFGLSEKVKKSIIESIDEIKRYPDTESRELISDISEYHGIDKKYIVCGNGAADVIFRAVKAINPENALIIAPTFSEYERALREAGSNVDIYILRYPMYITEEVINDIEYSKYDLIFLCNPNNPTGILLDSRNIYKIVENCHRAGTKLFIDECFMDMTDENNSVINLCDRYNDIYILKSLTKMYAMPGLRVGYAISSDVDMIEKIRNTGQPWSVNTLAGKAASAALKDNDYRNKLINHLTAERRYMKEGLKALGFEVWDSKANYVFFRVFDKIKLDKELERYGIMIRNCEKMYGLGQGFYRVCIGLRQDNEYLLKSMESVVSGYRSRKLKCRSIMVQGTMSNSGKSFITAGLCRIFNQDGYRTAPFKSQNMALNSYITAEGGEIGRAQAMQAESAGIEASVNMNPILLKPSSDHKSQVIVKGEIFGTMDAKEYYARKQEFIPYIKEAYRQLSESNDIIVLEGAGSPAEINLKSADIVNMGMAKISDSPVILVGDIDRGGVFASIYGTIELLDEDERRRVKGIIINKFRGDISILQSGIEMLEKMTGIKVLGVVPYIDVDIEEEDSLSEKLLQKKIKQGSSIDIAVIRLPRISNFTDFDIFSRIEGVSLRYISDKDEVGNPDMIIIPGTKSTISDLKWLRQSGIEAKILKSRERGTVIAGICGGYQMLGKELNDPEEIETGEKIRGIGLLEVTTVFKPYKHRSRICGKVNKIEGILSGLSEQSFSGYEIHQGETTGEGGHFLTFEDGTGEGYISSDGNIFGTYVHGFFDNMEIAEKIVNILKQKKGIKSDVNKDYDWKKYKNEQYDKLADCLRASLDIDEIYSVINNWGIMNG